MKNIDHRGQAMTEMAIFGTLILVCFAVLVSYGQSFIEQQTLLQESFRLALSKAYSDNGYASYSILKTTRNPNLFGSYREGTRSSGSGSGAVLWCKGDIENFSYYHVNDQVLELHPFEQGEDEDAEIPSVFDVQTNATSSYSGMDVKNENTAQITTARQATVTDNVTITLRTKYDSYGDGPTLTVNSSLSNDGSYTSGGAGMSRSRTWTTPH